MSDPVTPPTPQFVLDGDALDERLTTHDERLREINIDRARAGLPPAAPLSSLAGRVVWCQCWGTPEPDGPWIHPDDEHADTCGIDALKAETRAQEGHCTCEYPYPAEVWQGHHPNCDLERPSSSDQAAVRPAGLDDHDVLCEAAAIVRKRSSDPSDPLAADLIQIAGGERPDASEAFWRDRIADEIARERDYANDARMPGYAHGLDRAERVVRGAS